MAHIEDRKIKMTFGELLNSLRKRLLFLVNTYTLSPNIAKEDLFQEASILLYENYLAGKCEGKNNTYLINACRFALNNYLRRKMLKNDLISLSSLREEELDEPGSNDWNLKMERSILLRELPVLVHFTFQEHRVWKLLISGYTLREIGEVLSVSHVRVAKIKTHIKEKLHRLPKRVSDLL